MSSEVSSGVAIAEEELAASFAAYVTANHVAPGLAYGIVSADGLGARGGLRVRQPCRSPVPTADTPFPDRASMSKSFCAAARRY